VSSQAATCPHCGRPLTATAQPPPIQSGGQTPPSKNKKSKFKIGCLGFLIIIGILILIGAIADYFGPSVSIEGSTGHIKHTLLVNTMSTAEFDVAQVVYQAAVKHPELKQIDVDLELGALDGLVDQYGKTVPGPYTMGTITITNLDEVRKFADEFSYERQYQIDYQLQLQNLKYSEQLKNE
jgi:hypothetical protein